MQQISRLLGFVASGVPWVLCGCQHETGLAGGWLEDVYRQSTSHDVDILWVIDNSESMVGERALVADGVEAFTQHLENSEVDFHLGVITTTFERGHAAGGALIGVPRVLTREDPYVRMFARRATEGVHEVVAADKERGLAAAAHAASAARTSAGRANEGFFRDGAHLLVVVVSDEDDCSDNGRLDGLPAKACTLNKDDLPEASSFVSLLRNRLRLADDELRIAAIVGQVDSFCFGVRPGTRYAQAARLTGGFVGDLCAEDWTDYLDELGVAAAGLQRSFVLSSAALPDRLYVEVDGEEVPESPTVGWTYDPRRWAVDFHGPAVPPSGATVVARYKPEVGGG